MKKLLLVLSASLLLGGCAHQREDYAGYAAGDYPYGLLDCYDISPYDYQYLDLPGPCGYGSYRHHGFYYYYLPPGPSTLPRQKVAPPRHSGNPRVVTHGSKGSSSRSSRSSSGHSSRSSSGSHSSHR